MKTPNWAKIMWWIFLVGFLAFLFSQRYESIMSGVASATDIAVFLILIALLIIPIFQEVSIFGVSFKKEIQNLKSEFEKQISILKSEIQNTINIYPPTPSSDSELQAIGEHIRPILEQILKDHGVERPTSISTEPDVPDNTRLLFSVRYSLEKELRRLASLIWPPYLEKRHQSILTTANILSEMGKITPQVVSMIREVNAICSSAIHGSDVSEASVRFVRDTSPSLLAYLKSMEGLQWLPKEHSS